MDYLLFIILFIGFLCGAGFAAAVLLYYLAEQREVEKKKLQQELSAKLTRECYQEKKELARKNEIESNQVKLELERSVKGSDKQTEQIRAYNKEIETLNYQIRDAEYALNQAKEDLVKLQAAYQKLAADYRKQQGRLDLAEARVKDAAKQEDMLVFAVNQLREIRAAYKKLEKRLT